LPSPCLEFRSLRPHPVRVQHPSRPNCPCSVRVPLMREQGLRARKKRLFSTHHRLAARAPRRGERARSAVPGRDTPNTAWGSDITDLWTHEGWLYLVVILDLFSRRVVGWALHDRITRQLALDALAMALRHRQPRPGLVHHSDRGGQYASGDYQAVL